VNLGLINLLPVPVLDGGHVLVFAIEGVSRRRCRRAPRRRSRPPAWRSSHHHRARAAQRHDAVRLPMMRDLAIDTSTLTASRGGGDADRRGARGAGGDPDVRTDQRAGAVRARAGPGRGSRAAT
jgi:hypothetical protein